MFKRKRIYRKRKSFPKLIKIKSSTGNWSFTNKSGNASSPANVSQNSVQFGFPKITQVVYPGQCLRLNSGWDLTQMPPGTVMHSIPHDSLIDSNLIATPQISQPGDTGPMVQNVYNNSSYPIRIQLEPRMTSKSKKHGFFHLKPNGQQQKLQGIDAGHLVNTFLGLAANIVPMFL